MVSAVDFGGLKENATMVNFFWMKDHYRDMGMARRDFELFLSCDP